MAEARRQIHAGTLDDVGVLLAVFACTHCAPCATQVSGVRFAFDPSRPAGSRVPAASVRILRRLPPADAHAHPEAVARHAGVVSYSGMTPIPSGAGGADPDAAYSAAAASCGAGAGVAALDGLEGGLGELLFVSDTPKPHAPLHPHHHAFASPVSSADLRPPATPVLHSAITEPSATHAAPAGGERGPHDHQASGPPHQLHRAFSAPHLETQPHASGAAPATAAPPDKGRRRSSILQSQNLVAGHAHGAVAASSGSSSGSECHGEGPPHSHPPAAGISLERSQPSPVPGGRAAAPLAPAPAPTASGHAPQPIAIHQPPSPLVAEAGGLGDGTPKTPLAPPGFGWQPLEPAARYSLAVRGFTSKGKDGYACLLSPEVRTLLDAELGPSQHSIITTHFKALDALAELAAASDDGGAGGGGGGAAAMSRGGILRPHRVRPDLDKVARIVLPGAPLARLPQSADASAAGVALAADDKPRRRFVFAVAPVLDGRIAMIPASSSS